MKTATLLLSFAMLSCTASVAPDGSKAVMVDGVQAMQMADMYMKYRAAKYSAKNSNIKSPVVVPEK